MICYKQLPTYLTYLTHYPRTRTTYGVEQLFKHALCRNTLAHTSVALGPALTGTWAFSLALLHFDASIYPDWALFLSARSSSPSTYTRQSKGMGTHVSGRRRLALAATTQANNGGTGSDKPPGL